MVDEKLKEESEIGNYYSFPTFVVIIGVEVKVEEILTQFSEYV